MSEVHEIAARGFGAQADAYDRARPSYPPEAVDWLVEGMGIKPGQRVVDLAAGTGKLTALLTGTGADLMAVEPVGSMRDRLRRQLPEVPVLAGVAEALPFADNTLDAVLVAQAFHWFEASRAMAEIARVVRPGGHLGLIWNARDRSPEWVDQVWSVMDRVERNAPWRDRPAGYPGGGDERYPARSGDSRWSAWVDANFFHVHYGSHDDVLDRMRSVSHIAALPAACQQNVLDEIRAVLAENSQTRHQATVGIPYRVDAMYVERTG
jgi:SAM-dependent methyltransferase